MQIVSNSTILIALSRIGHLWLLEKLFNELIIPQAVYIDVVVKGAGKPGSKDVADAEWIRVFNVKDTEALDEFLSIIHRGEAEAIELALELGVDLIILDDDIARQIAIMKGLNVVGTLAVLRQAKEKNLIPILKPLLDALRSVGFYIGDEYNEILMDLGEL
ncbi:TPA: DUF3368 domain-containing protein [Candidatus Poribacteria bacterium]|nr:DUF3368 domain-containing protein [Candidatus Poribacteria bacterium]